MTNWKKSLLASMLIIALIIPLAGCGGSGAAVKGGTAGTQAKPIELKISTGAIVADSLHNLSTKEFAEKLNKEANGRIKVTVVPGASFGGEKQLAEAMQMGTFEMALVSDIGVNGLLGNMGWAFLPMMITNREDADKYYRHGWMGEKLAEQMLAGGLVRVGEADNGLRNLATASKPVRSLADLKGLKTRVPGLDSLLDFWKEAGALSVSVPSAEQIPALEQGMMDAIDNNLYGQKGNGVIDSLHTYTVTGHHYSSGSYVASKIWWDKLAKEDQDLIKKVATEVGENFSKNFYAEEEKLYNQYVKSGKMVQYDLDADSVKKLKEISVKIWDKYASKYDPAIMAKIKQDFGTK